MAAADPWFAPLIGLCGFARLRLGETAGVQLGDIDFRRKTLTVSRQVQRAGQQRHGPATEVRLRANRVPARRIGDDAG
jgi:integrase